MQWTCVTENYAIIKMIRTLTHVNCVMFHKILFCLIQKVSILYYFNPGQHFVIRFSFKDLLLGVTTGDEVGGASHLDGIYSSKVVKYFAFIL